MGRFWTLVLGVTIPALLTIMLSGTVNRANADSTIATITVGTGPYGAVFDPDNGYIYTANVAAGSYHRVKVTRRLAVD